MYMYIYIYIYICVCMYVCMYVYIYMYVCVYVCLYANPPSPHTRGRDMGFLCLNEFIEVCFPLPSSKCVSCHAEASPCRLQPSRTIFSNECSRGNAHSADLHQARTPPAWLPASARHMDTLRAYVLFYASVYVRRYVSTFVRVCAHVSVWIYMCTRSYACAYSRMCTHACACRSANKFASEFLRKG